MHKDQVIRRIYAFQSVPYIVENIQKVIDDKTYHDSMNLIKYVITLIKSGGGMCPLKPGNRHINMKWCQFTKVLTFGDERKTFLTPFSYFKE